MATVTIAHKPELTAERAMEPFRSHFAGKYDVYAPRRFEKWFSGKPHFVVRKSRWAAVAVWLRHSRSTTSFRFSGMLPPETLVGAIGAVAGILTTCLIAWIMLRPSWKAIEGDIALLIENAAEFR